MSTDRAEAHDAFDARDDGVMLLQRILRRSGHAGAVVDARTELRSEVVSVTLPHEIAESSLGNRQEAVMRLLGRLGHEGHLDGSGDPYLGAYAARWSEPLPDHAALREQCIWLGGGGHRVRAGVMLLRLRAAAMGLIQSPLSHTALQLLAAELRDGI